jgi:hypothetical protein
VEPEKAIADCHAFLLGVAGNAEQRADVKLAALLRGVIFPRNRIPEQGRAAIAGRTALVAGDGKKRRPGMADFFVARKKNVERAEKLPLAAAGAVIPIALERPHMREPGGRRIRATSHALVLIPVKEIQ